MYSFTEQLKKGEDGEKQLDEYFSAYCEIQKATMQEQRQGIDRRFKDKKTGETFTVEYKTDFIAHKTGNAFVETVSVDSVNKRGWSYNSKADYLLYFVVKDLLVYIISMDTVRCNLSRWASKYRKTYAQNEGYRTYGILVPLREFEEHSVQVISL